MIRNGEALQTASKITAMIVDKTGTITRDNPAMVVVVENGSYQPARIKLAANQAASLQFLREDASPCAETVIFPDLDN